MKPMKTKKIIGYDESKRKSLNEIFLIEYEPLSKKESNENFDKLFK